MNKIYEYVKKAFSNIKSIILSLVLLVLLLWAIISSARLSASQKHIRRLEQRLDDIRTELSNAQNRERELEETVGNIRGISERTDTLLDQSGTTIQGIREKIQVLENYFNSVNQCLSTDNHDNDNNSNSKE